MKEKRCTFCGKKLSKCPGKGQNPGLSYNCDGSNRIRDGLG